MDDTADVIETLNDLIETCKDGEYGFRLCSEHADSPQLKSTLSQRAAECQTAAAQLQAHVVALGGEADTDGSVLGAVHRGWVTVKASLSSKDDLAMLEECERGEDAALQSYRDALKTDLPAAIRTLVEQQADGVKRNHDLIRRLRDTLKAAN